MVISRFASVRWWVALVLIVAGGCRQPVEQETLATEGSRSPTAQMEIVEALRQDLVAPRHPADGGGRVQFEGTPDPALAGRPGTWSFVFETGPDGIDEGGWLFFQAPPFWGWSTPQVVAQDALGYTTVESDAKGLELIPSTIDQQLLAIQIMGRSLDPGEQIRIVYGAGSGGALADRYAESRSCFYFAVDADGDGIRSLLENQLCLEVGAGPAARLVLTLPTTARPGQRVKLTAAVLDALGNRAAGWSGDIVLQGPDGFALPESMQLEANAAGALSTWVEVGAPGSVVVRGLTADGLAAQSNPMVVADSISRILWADLHGHSGLSDGTGTPQDYFRFARDAAALDVVALTDHDHWGMEPLAVHPELWEEIRRETELFHRPGEFVTLLGYEWTSWIHGHRHVLYFSDHGEIYSSVAEEFETPAQLWQALRGQQALTFAHHSAGGPIATNWEYPPDPELEPVTEIVSVHGSSEAMDSPARIYSPVEGNFVRDALDRGFEMGFVGSGDSHDGHPGLAYLNAVSGGLAAILSEELTREGVLEALRARRVYATNGPRIWLSARIGDHPMGSTLDSRLFGDMPAGERRLRVAIVAPAALDRIDVVKSGQIVHTASCEGQRHCSLDLPVADVQAGEYIYVRGVQQDGGAAWSSPFFFRQTASES